MNLALKTSFVRKEITSRSGGSTRYNIGQESLSKVQVCLPVINEQQKIADFLSLVDKKIEQLTEKHRLLTDYKKGVMQQIFSQQIRFKDENGNDYPEWEKKKITEIAKTSIGLVTSMTPYYVDCGVPLIRNNDIFQNRIRKEGLIQLDYDFDILNKHRRLKRYDIVTVHTGEIGVSAVIDEMLDGAQGFATLNTRVKELSKTCPFFLSWYYNSSENIKYALSMATGDGRSNYNLKDFNKAIIPYPSFEEQQKIANFLTEIDQKIDQAWSTLEQTKAFKKGLLQQMFV
jgi:type I restriction enzyme S subunit